MDSSESEDSLLVCNKIIEEKIDYLVDAIDRQLDCLYLQRIGDESSAECQQPQQEAFSGNQTQTRKLLFGKTPNYYSINTFLPFKAPYIKDARNFSSPLNCDVKHIRELSGADNIDSVLKRKSWSRESKRHLEDAVLEHYAQTYILGLIKHKNHLHNQMKQLPPEERTNIEHKMRLISEQIEQVKTRQDPHTFVPQDRNDSNIDWLATSAKLANTPHDAQDCRLMWSNSLHWSINKGDWTRDEDDSLVSAVEKHGRNDWDSVAKDLNNNRLPWQCCARYLSEFSHNCAGGKPTVTPDGVAKIIEVVNLCRIGEFIPWNQVMYFIQYYTLPQVKYQWQKYVSEEKFASCPWTQEEDAALIRTVKKYGSRDWVKIANFIPNRSSRSCRERYVMRLRFEKRSVGEWRPQESQRLRSLATQCELQWSKIADHFPDRNPHQIRSKFCCLQKQKERLLSGSSRIRKRTLYKNAQGFLMSCNKSRQKPNSEIEVDKKLDEIFKTYSNVKTKTKSLVYRSEQDEAIYQNLVQTVRTHMLTDHEETVNSFIKKVLIDALNERVTYKEHCINATASGCECIALAPPNLTTIRGYKCWSLLQDYLKEVVCSKFSEDELNLIDVTNLTSNEEYNSLIKQTLSLFLWPSILEKLEPPQVDPKKYSDVFESSIVNKDNLYIVRELQKQMTSFT